MTKRPRPNPIDPLGGEIGKQEGISRAARASNPEWWQAALEALKEAATNKPILNTDDVYTILYMREAPSTHENRAFGPVMLYGASQGWIIRTDHWAESRRRTAHRRPIRVWYSLIYQGNQPVKQPRPRRMLDPRQFDLSLWPLG